MHSQPNPLVLSKFSAPSADARQIVRDSLVDLVAQSPAHLVLVRAPAGFGKTTLMGQVRQRLRIEMATEWLTLDAADNDPARFLAYLGCLLGRIAALEMPDEAPWTVDASPVGEAALNLMDRIAAVSQPFALFIDDLELVTAPGAMALVAQLLDRLPVGARLVLGSRSMPDLRLARLRAGGQLLEIHAQKLRFALDETHLFFQAQGAGRIAPDEIRQLHGKTEGWVAALWLASLALEQHQQHGHFIASFSGTEEGLADYLAEEVLAQQAPPVQQLLLATSILRELSEPVCAALLPDLDSGAILRQLAAAHVFIVPIDERPGHWRYHSLFACFLRSQLERTQPGAVQGLHRAAARWFESQGRPVPAVDHYLAAKDAQDVLRVLAREAMPLLMQGRLRLLMRWFDALPAAALAGHPLLQVAHLWATCFTRGPQASLAVLAEVGLEHSADAEIRVHVAALQSSVLALLDRWEEAHAVGTQSLHLLPSASSFADSALVNVSANAAAMLGAFPKARALLDRARQQQGQGASDFHRMYSESIEGMIDLREGRLRQARARFRLALQSSQGQILDGARGNAWAGILYAVSVYEENDLQQARRLLQVYVPLARDVWLSDHVVMGHRMLARIAFAEGEIDHAYQGLSELEYLGHERRQPRLVAAARLERGRLLLMQGHHEASAEELKAASLPELWREIGGRRHLSHDSEDPQNNQLRWQIIAGDARDAAPAVAELAAQAERGGRIRRAWKLQLLHAMALSRSGDEDGAQATLLRMLQAGCGEGAVRLVLEEGAILARVLRRLQARLDPVRAGPIFMDYVQRLVTAFGPLGQDDAAPDARAVTAAALAEPLTPKEVRLLQLLAEGYSNRALTEKLFVSDSTVRTHLRNINGKLGAGNRTQAVSLARRMGLIA